jgi:2-polyprenyl-6-methoxyphenol hydroxylase-like FAD-dependent oxidoreductase
MSKLMYDVVIAGAGPTGLFLACELQLAGVAVLVLEQLPETRTPLKERFMGARGLNLPSVEACYRRGLLPDVRETALAWIDVGQEPGMSMTPKDSANAPQAPRFAGHFAGIILDGNKIDFSNDKYLTAGPAASGGIVSLAELEGVLRKRAEKLGVAIRLDTPVVDFEQDAEGVRVHANGEVLRTRWLVGCDGGRSAVRKRAGFAFEGTDPELTGTTAVADFADPEKLKPGWNITALGMYMNGPVPGRIGVVEFDGGRAAREPVTVESLQATLRRISDTDITVTAIHVATRYTDHARQATTYRQGRVLLAGDAAHVHSPFGGQGMNLGIGDAINLGWKLAATIKGWAPQGLLDTYTAERHPVGAWALEWTRAQVSILRPEPHARAMAAIVRDLIDTREGASYFARKISGAGLRYDIPGDHPLMGRSAPDLELEDGTRLGDLLHKGWGVLWNPGGSADLKSLQECRANRVLCVSAKAKNDLGLTAMLVRPDGFVGWASDGEPDTQAAATAMQLWFGDG